ncbi:MULTISPECIES: TrkH family potassium uptake protein [Legionella]|uniref:Trk system potassium uptake protein n=1 Tax=Legionella maceachernii TaxID=466 RepID=A0A0W0W3P9_9GAMM|nr:TrkH family potassium uptake protein [Legionella maceachernii]KTD27013.1 Trk system potassium uptake protein TrkH [Legionella maceachernii]SKA03207.1 trk system potassium uptake protein TrkH [Legionella maceachernii]SUP00158.1 Trk system potassium uptake protein trkG [Legionella maceachernii]
MQIKTILRLLGLLLMMFSLSMLTPLIINVIFWENFWFPFVVAFICTFLTGFLLWLCCRSQHHELKIREGFIIVVLFWFVLCFFASLPFIFVLHQQSHGMTDAFFETVSGLTTTGATVIEHLQGLPQAILFYRQQLQFLGGMGIVVLAVAILPMLGVGGMQLFRAETPGPMKDAKLTPRIAHTAKAMWYIYLLLTIICMGCYWVAGMDWFDALGESFATVSTGGFSMHDNSFAFYQNDIIELIACFFMLLGGTNFALHFIAFQKKSLRHYWHDEEFRNYIFFLISATVLVGISLVLYGFFRANHHAFIKSLFNVISMATTTGFISAQFSNWPTYIPLLITLLALIGGCAGSTSGGVKVIRALLIYKQSKREIVRLIHPNAIIPIKFGKHSLAEPILQSMWGFLSVFIALFFGLVLLFMALGNDFLTSFSAITASLSNSGAGIGSIHETCAHLNPSSKWVMIFAMLAGRLEIFSLLILFSPYFWQK